MKKTLIISGLVSFLPAIVLADNIQNLGELIDVVITAINSLVPLLFGLAILSFMWSIIRYLYAADPKKLGEARNYIVFSIIAIAVMLAVWSLSFLVKNLFFEGVDTPLSGRT